MGGSFRWVKGKDLCLVVVSFVTALLAFFLFWGEVVVVVVFVAFLVDRVVFASPTAFLSAFFFRAGILLSLSLEFGDPGLNLLVFAMMEIRKEWSACRVRSELITTDHNQHTIVGNVTKSMVSNAVTYVNILLCVAYSNFKRHIHDLH